MRYIRIKHKKTSKINEYKNIKKALIDINQYDLRYKVYRKLSKGKPFENEEYIITRKTIK